MLDLPDELEAMMKLGNRRRYLTGKISMLKMEQDSWEKELTLVERQIARTSFFWGLDKEGFLELKRGGFRRSPEDELFWEERKWDE